MAHGSRASARAAALVVAGATLSCGASKHEAPEPSPISPVDLAGEAAKSGERLQAIYFVSDEGLRVPTLRFLDTERNEECTFKKSDAGDWRCFPDAEPDSPPFDLLDADCRTPVFPACGAYAERAKAAGCDSSGTRLYELGAVIDVPPADPPDCVFHLQTGAGDRYRRLGARIPNDAFVRAVAGVPTDSDRIGVEQLSAEDGSGLLLGFFNHVDGKPCEALSFNYLPHYCVPSPYSSIFTFFSDESCSSNGRRLGTGVCQPQPSIGYSSDEDTFYRLGRATGNVPPFFGDDGNEPDGRPAACLPSEPWQGYEVREAVNVSAFETLELTNTGEGRVQLGVARTGDGRVMVPDPVRDRYYLWDDELGVSCSIAISTDGEYRCLPVLYDTQAANLFADDQCQVPLAALAGGAPSSKEPTWLVVTNDVVEGGCNVSSSTVAYELAPEPFTGPTYIPTTDLDGSPLCYEVTETGTDPLFAPAGEVDPESFVRFAREAE